MAACNERESNRAHATPGPSELKRTQSYRGPDLAQNIFGVGSVVLRLVFVAAAVAMSSSPSVPTFQVEPRVGPAPSSSIVLPLRQVPSTCGPAANAPLAVAFTSSFAMAQELVRPAWTEEPWPSIINALPMGQNKSRVSIVTFLQNPTPSSDLAYYNKALPPLPKSAKATDRPPPTAPVPLDVGSSCTDILDPKNFWLIQDVTQAAKYRRKRKKMMRSLDITEKAGHIVKFKRRRRRSSCRR
ncbi:hypothetical protein R3P38DRAFT_2804206 [Favolaschia claudopus]|uniref:Mitochondrial mRNA-processing protein COX24 C-terminal domain-containing protein n=1 Tax=Favolaschia claudopus TaxID=2862362 RepID=A0AAV9ZQX1_9AGAR